MTAPASTGLADVFAKIIADPRYSTGVTYGKARTGHAEGSVSNHLVQLDKNLWHISQLLSAQEFVKLRILIHVHDTFKYWAKKNSAIEDPKSHASLARAFLAEFTDDQDLLYMVQYHDENFALWKQVEAKGRYNKARFEKLIVLITDMTLFLFFTIIDGYTPSKQHERIRWFVDEVNKVVNTPRVYEALEEFGI